MYIFVLKNLMLLLRANIANNIKRILKSVITTC